MENFINQEYIENLIIESTNTSEAEIDAILDKATLQKGLSHQEVAKLLNISNPKQIEKLHTIAYDLKKAIYGDRIVLFAPLYVSNHCVNNCAYCGYKRDNKFPRVKLSMPEIKKEVEELEKIGHKRLALELGEDEVNTNIDYVIDAIKTIYSAGDIRRINVNIAATTKENYEKLKDAEIGTYILFQETYHKPTYELLHPDSLKGNYNRQLLAHHKAIEAGLDDVGGGVLFGLADYRYELIALMMHNEELLRQFGVEFHTISVPRLKKAEGVDLNNYPHLIDDDTFVKLVSIIRIAAPHVGMILSTREDEAMRMRLIKQGISQISANSKTTVGGYTDEHNVLQFELGDERSLTQTMKDLLQAGNLPSYCTGCYRMGRTGQDFHKHVESHKIANMCHPNAILTTLEFVLDSDDSDIYNLAYPFLLEQVELIKDATTKDLVKTYFKRIEEGERDLYV